MSRISKDLISAAAVRSLPSTTFLQRLEKHLSDVRKGRGYLSDETGMEVANKRRDAATLLAGNDLGNFRDYLGYLTAFSYDKRARFISAVEGAGRRVAKITEEA